MDNLVRTDIVFGKRVNIVGNISADLVLESLGKIYIKSRNKSLTIEEVITSLVTQDPNTSTSRTKIVEGIENLDTSELKEGTFVFDKLSNILYLFIDGELLELINVAPDGTGFVKRSGDTMTGRLAIYVKNGPPLYVNSTDLVLNLNAQFLNGETADNFTRRTRDEKIDGSWTFRSPTIFDSNTLFYKDIVTHGSVGTQNFSSGFGGYGWRMDADTNTLTVDNLVVRKLMQVYELVVNKISATNGSLWVTNAGKVTKVIKLPVKDSSFFLVGDYNYDKFASGLTLGNAFIKLGIKEIRLLDLEAFMTASGEGIHVKEGCLTVESLLDAKLIIITSRELEFDNLTFDDPSGYNEFPLFDPDFKFDCTFPIVTRASYLTYKKALEDTIKALAEIDRLNLLEDPPLNEINALLGIINTNKLNANPYTHIKYSLPYYKYFAGGDYYLVSFDSDELPVFKPGDLLRCQKWTYNGIKYYDAVVCSLMDTSYVILLADSMLDKKTTITYNSSLEPKIIVLEDNINEDLYNSSLRRANPTDNPVGIVEEKDGLVLMGHLWDPLRLNAVYITSTDNGAPFMDVLSGINRPDFSVIYYTPIFKTIKLFAKAKGNARFNGIDATLVEGIPQTINYYILDNSKLNCDYTYVKVTGRTTTDYYMIKGYRNSVVSLDNGYTCSIEYYLNLSPDKDTLLISDSDLYYILLEDGDHLDVGTYIENGSPAEGGHFLLESRSEKLLIASTKTTKARLGNLDGILDELFPLNRQPYGYGLYGLNVFLTGEFYLSNGQAVAEIGKDAITFALAGQLALGNSIELLRYDTNAAYNLLKLNVYSKGYLKTAGMYIGNDSNGNPGIVMWGNQIIIATTPEEFYGIALPTALFYNGKILAKFLEVHDAYSDVKYEYAAIESTYSKKKNYDENYWTHIQYSASGGYNVSINNPNATGGVKIYTYEDNGLTKTKYIRKFHIDMFQNNVTDSDMRNGTYSGGDSNYDAWIEVGLDGNIPDITDIHYVTFNIGDTLYDGTSLGTSLNTSVFTLLDDVVNTVLKDVTLWSLRSDGTGNLGGKAIYWDLKGNLIIDSDLKSLRGSIGNLLYFRSNLYFNILESNNSYIEASYPKMLLHDDRLKSSLLFVSFEEIPISIGSSRYIISLSAHSILEAGQFYMRLGYNSNCVEITPLEGLIYEIDNKASMGVSYPLLNLMIIPYGSNGGDLDFYIRCNYVPQIKKIDTYYLREGVYYFVIDCNDSLFTSFLENSFKQGNLQISVTGINKMFGGLGYFDNEGHEVYANIGAINLGQLSIGNSNNPVRVGGSDAWWKAEITKTLLYGSGSSIGLNNGGSTLRPKNMNSILMNIDSSLIALKVETVNNSGKTEGGVSLLLNYNYFLDNYIPTIPVRDAESYDDYLLLEWIKYPYTSQYTDFVSRYNSILGVINNGSYPSGTLGYHILFINLLADNGHIYIGNIPGEHTTTLPDSSSLLSILETIINDSTYGINISTIKTTSEANNYIYNLSDSMSLGLPTFSGYVCSAISAIYMFLANDGTSSTGLASTDDYNKDITLHGLAPIYNISPSLYSFTVPSITSTTKQDIAKSLRSFVERECYYMEQFLNFLDKLLYNIINLKIPDIAVSPIVLSTSNSRGTLNFTITTKSNINWSISNNVSWCYVGVPNGLGGLTTNGSGDATGEIRINANTTYDDRTATIVISGGDTSIELTLIQASRAFISELSVNTTEIISTKNGGTYLVNITCNDSWTISGSSENWFSISPASGTGNGIVTITIQSNFSTENRGATLTVTSGLETETISLSLAGNTSELGTYQYSVGLLSDLHINTDTSDPNSDAGDEDDLTNALLVFLDEGVDFIAGCGDVLETWEPWSENWTRTSLDAQLFYDTYTDADCGLNFFTPLGNHDYFGLYEKRDANETNSTASATRILNIWALYVLASEIMGSLSVTYLADSNNLTYYFTKDDDIYVILSLDYGGDTYEYTGSGYRNTIEAKNLIDITNVNNSNITAMVAYVSDTGYNSTNDSKYNYLFYSPKSLIWLKNLIEGNTDKKIFVFTHHFLPHKVGNSNGIPSNGYAYGDIRGNDSFSGDYTSIRRGASALCGILFWFINKLNNEHKNVYWFSGHSHISWNYNTGDELKCAHIDNNDYSIVAPSTSDHNSSDNSDPKKKTVYTKSSMTSTGTSGWWISLPSLSKPRSISGSSASYLYDESELTIMDVYTNGIKIKGYKAKRANSTYSLEKLIEKDLLLDGGSSSGEGGNESGGGESGGGESGGEITPSENGITFILHNNSGVEARFNGRVVLNIALSATDWTNSTLVEANIHAESVNSWHTNDIIIPVNGTYSWSPLITALLPGSPNHSDAIGGTWHLMSATNPNNQYMYPVFIYSAYCYGDKPTDTSAHSSQNMYIPGAPDTTLLLNGGVYNINITALNSNATLLPDLTGHYVVLSQNSTGLTS